MARSRTELDPKFRRLMQRLPADVTDQVTRAIQESAQAVWVDAVKRVPIDTGDLQASIGLRITPTSAEVGFSSKRFRREWKRAGWRAKFVELGTKGSAKRNIPPMTARPFLRPAFEANRRWIMERHRAAVAAVLNRAAAL
jgi:HK97 gp10 family phage protein